MNKHRGGFQRVLQGGWRTRRVILRSAVQLSGPAGVVYDPADGHEINDSHQPTVCPRSSGTFTVYYQSFEFQLTNFADDGNLVPNPWLMCGLPHQQGRKGRFLKLLPRVRLILWSHVSKQPVYKPDSNTENVAIREQGGLKLKLCNMLKAQVHTQGRREVKMWPENDLAEFQTCRTASPSILV